MTTRNRHPSGPVDPAPGLRLRRLRLDRNMTQRELAQPHYTKAYISALENGLIRFSLAAGAYLAERLGVSLVELLEGDQMTAIRDQVESLPPYDGHRSGMHSGQREMDLVRRKDVLDILGAP